MHKVLELLVTVSNSSIGVSAAAVVVVGGGGGEGEGRVHRLHSQSVSQLSQNLLNAFLSNFSSRLPWG